MSFLSKSFSTPLKTQYRIKTPIGNKTPKFPQITTLPTAPSLKSSLTSQLKMRKEKKDLEITPVYAAQVVKKYLLPMFENSKSHKRDLMRKYVMNRSGESQEPSSNLHQEFQLSEKLLKELEAKTSALLEAEEKVSRIEQEKYELRAEIGRLAKENEDLNINLRTISVQAGSKSFLSYEMMIYVVQKQLDKYKQIYKNCETKLDQVMQELHNEKSLNDIRFNFCKSLTPKTN